MPRPGTLPAQSQRTVSRLRAGPDWLPTELGTAPLERLVTELNTAPLDWLLTELERPRRTGRAHLRAREC
jgi:hypothetical protein